jgi:hypothetical protein
LKLEIMKTLIYLFILLPFLAFSQVGINTTTPNAMMDVNSANNGVLIPRIALTSITDATTVVNPTGGALTTSTLVYNTATAGVIPNNVIPGFYYWNNTLSKWISIGGKPGWELEGNSGITTPADPAVYGTSTLATNENFIGTKDANDVVFATDNVERMRIKNTTGYVGVGEDNPQSKLDISTDVAGLTALHARNRYIGNIDGRGLYADASINPGYGTGGYFRGGRIGVDALALSGTTTGTTIAVRGSCAGLGGLGTRIGGYFSATGAINNYGLIVASGYTGINTSSPTTNFHVFGQSRFQDGTQGVGKVLTSDANGVASWQNAGITNVVGNLSAIGANIPYNQTANFLQTGSYIILPPGRYAVNVTMLLARNSTSLPSPNNSSFWVRSTFSNSSGINPLPSADIVGSTLASGNFAATSLYSMLTGTIIINNTSAVNRIYYYVAGRSVAFNTTETLTGFGSTYWQENNIIAYRLN